MRRSRKSALVVVLFALAGASLLAPSARADLPTPALEHLPNGLTIARFPNERLPLFDALLWVPLGHRLDPAGKSGAVQLLASLLDRGARGWTAEALARKIEALGGERSLSVDDDALSIGIHGLSPDAPELLDLLSAMALESNLDAREMAKQRERLLDGWEHLGDQAGALAGLVLRRSLGAGTPYGRGALLTAREMRAVTRADLLALRRQGMAPTRAALLLVGRWDEARLRAVIDQRFGAWKAPPGAARAAARPAAFRDRRVPAWGERFPRKPGEALRPPVILVDRPGATQAEVKVGTRAPGFGDPRTYPLLVANAFLGETFNSRLNSLLRDQLGLTYGAGSSLDHARELGMLSAGAATRNERVGELLKKLLDLLDDFATGTISPEELSGARDYLSGSFAVAHSTVGAIASRWLVGHAWGFGPEFMNAFLPAIAAVTDVRVRDAVSPRSGALDLSKLVVVVAGDARSLGPELTRAGFRVRARLSAADLK